MTEPSEESSKAPETTVDPVPTIYESDDLKSIASLMDDLSKHNAPLTLKGEAFVIKRSWVHNHKLSGEAAWATYIEFLLE
jgi:hypothetical protein